MKDILLCFVAVPFTQEVLNLLSFLPIEVNYKPKIHWLKKRGESDESLKHSYGIAGIHYEDANAVVTVITPKGTSKVKGGMAAFVDMGDDSHTENHVSPLCKMGVK